MKTNKKTAKTEKNTTPARAQEQLDAKKQAAPSGPLLEGGVLLAEHLNHGTKIEWPKGANAVRAKVGDKTTVVLKADADTLKDVGVTTAEFGAVPLVKGKAIREKFQALATGSAAAPKTEKAAKTPKPAKEVKPALTAYPAGTLREVILLAGATAFKTNEELVVRIAASAAAKGFLKDQIARCLTTVVSNPKHPFNGGVSEVKKAADGSMTIVALKHPAAAPAATK